MIKVNSQTPESKITSEGETLEVHSIFYTIQGEGPHSGRPSVFVRLAGCNLQCPACDTEYTSKRETLDILAVISRIAQFVPRWHNRGELLLRRMLVVITGGEPFRQNITPLVDFLYKLNIDVQIETNGTYPPSPDLSPYCDIICSPKTGSVNQRLVPKITAYKYVLSHSSFDHTDGLPKHVLAHTAGGRVARPHLGFMGPVYIQPADSGDADINKLNMDACVESCMLYGYTLQLQIHKLLGVE